MYGIASLSFNRAKEQIYLKDSIKTPNIFTMRLCKTSNIYHPYSQIGLSTGTLKHTHGRAIIITKLSVFNGIHRSREKAIN